MATPVSAVVTDVGITAAVNAGTAGPEIEITYFKIGSSSQAEGCQALTTNTDVTNFVYQGTTDQMTYSVVDEDTVMYRIVLETDVGPFEIGNIGLFMPGGTMFAQAVLPQQTPKWENELPAQVGNRKIIDIFLVLSNQAAIVDLTILMANECSLPVVPTEVQLPNPATSPYNTYQVQNHTQLGASVIAFRFNGAWCFAPERKLAGAGQTILAINQNLFDVAAPVGSIISLDYDQNIYGIGDPASATNPLIGIRSSTAEITTIGYYQDLTASWNPGQLLYAGTGTNLGRIINGHTGFPIGFAITATRAWVNFSGGSSYVDLFSQYFNVNLVTYRMSPLPTTWTTLYTVPSGINQRFVVFGIHITNRFDSQNDISARIQTANGTLIRLAWQMSMEAYESLDLILKMVVLQPGDQLQLLATYEDDTYGQLDGGITGVALQDTNLIRVNKYCSGATPIPLFDATIGRDYTIQSMLCVNVHPASIPIPVTVTRAILSTGELWGWVIRHPIPANSSLELCDQEQKILDGHEIQVNAGTLGGLTVVCSMRAK